jgi:putative dimethyl sulfoxide reductase chaperone
MSAVAATAGAREVALLRLCSLLVASPTRARVGHARAIVAALRATDDDDTLRALDSELEEERVVELAGAHERLFGGSVAISPHEGGYEVDPFRQARQMADVAGFYRAFGAEAHGRAGERPDHAGCELEFLAYLGARRLEAETSGCEGDAQLCAEIETAFLREHAGRWLPAFFSALADREGSGFFGIVGRLGGTTIASVLADRHVEPEPAGPRAALLSVQADEIECGAEGLASPVEELARPHRRRGRRT